MHAFIRRAVCAAGLTGGVLLLGVGLAEAASADDGPVTTGQDGIVSGNQTAVGAQAPIDLSGNQVTVVGHDNTVQSTGSATTTEPAPESTSTSPTTSGEDGIASGNQTGVEVEAPVNVSGNQVTAVGDDNTVQSTGSSSTSEPAVSSGSTGATTSGEDGIASGNQTGVDVQVPINVSCNQVTVIGHDNTDECSGASSSTSATGDDSATTTGQDGLISGNQTLVGLQAPVNASGNQVTVIGDDNTVSSEGSSTSGQPATGSSPTGPTTSGEDGIASGNQTGIDAQVPVDLTGNQITVIGNDNTVNSTGGTTTGDTTGQTSTTGPVTSGEDGLISGNQTIVDVDAPVDGSGNQVTVIGNDNSNTSTDASTTGDDTGDTAGEGPVTNGEDGAGSGNQTIVDVDAPVDGSGNQVTVIGNDNSNTSTNDSTTGENPGDNSGQTLPPTTSPQGQTSGGADAAMSVTQAAAAPGAAVLPNTGASGPLLGLGLGGLLALLLGAALCRREGARICAE
ncbi:MAG TPA: chaplin family protein [Marmoricola sp.]|nr:chaplin family protein [Marmoricola sp.]